MNKLLNKTKQELDTIIAEKIQKQVEQHRLTYVEQESMNRALAYRICPDCAADLPAYKYKWWWMLLAIWNRANCPSCGSRFIQYMDECNWTRK